MSQVGLYCTYLSFGSFCLRLERRDATSISDAGSLIPLPTCLNLFGIQTPIMSRPSTLVKHQNPLHKAFRSCCKVMTQVLTLFAIDLNRNFMSYGDADSQAPLFWSMVITRNSHAPAHLQVSVSIAATPRPFIA